MPKKYICPFTEEELKKLYWEDGRNLNEMCEVMGIKSTITARRVLNRNGISTNKNAVTALKNRRGMNDDEFKDYLIKQYKDNSIRAIARELDVSQVVIRRYFEKYGIAFKPTREAQACPGEKNGRWKGGRKLSDGYIEVYAPNHPRKSVRNTVYEHDLVVEKSIGRYLKDGEVVHHIDGNKQNNDISNLMLMTNTDHVRLHNKLKRGDDNGQN